MSSTMKAFVHEIHDEVAENGFAIARSVVSTETLLSLKQTAASLCVSADAQRTRDAHSLRNLLKISPDIRSLAESSEIRSLVEPILGKRCSPVRGILFDKTPGANWKVPYHQDVTIAVREKIRVDGFGPWSTKSGVIHVQPPAPILDSMLSVRVHLDDCGEDNGALRVIPGSHREGRIPEAAISNIRSRTHEHICTAGAGDVLLMRPLLLHASSSSQVVKHRRVIHIDFAACALPGGLRWLYQ